MKSVPSAVAIAILLSSPCVCAQIGGDGSDGILDVTSTTVLQADTRPNGFNFRSITVRAGGTLTLQGSLPAILRSQGAVQIDGNVTADAIGAAAGPGGYDGGLPGLQGEGPGGGQAGVGSCAFPAYGTPGSHATGRGTTYGSAYPFDLRGGSGGGGTWHPGGFGCNWGQFSGGGGGGTIVVYADGPITVTGSITARGAALTFGAGAAGSILLRSTGAATITGTVSAVGGGAFGGGDGFVRIDCATCSLTGSITPLPTTVVFPRMVLTTPMGVGQTSVVRTDAITNDAVHLFAAAAAASIPLPWGTLELDPRTLVLLGQATSSVQATTEHWADVPVRVPNNAALRGVVLFLQPFAVAPTVTRARLGNSLRAQIQ